MCLTEANAGSDLGILRTKAERVATARSRSPAPRSTSARRARPDREHHPLVLARTPDAPPGTKGISLFVVPKLLPDTNASAGGQCVTCGSIERKMGIHASPTCVMHFNESVAGCRQAERGPVVHVPMMNHARSASACRAGLSELAWQASIATQTTACRAIADRRKASGQPADPIIVHRTCAACC